MIDVTWGIEVAIQLNYKPYTIEHLLDTLAANNVEIVALTPHSNGDGKQVLLITHDADRAVQVLEATKFECSSDSVICVEADRRYGGVAWIGDQLGKAGISILHSYQFDLSAGDRACVVFKTADDERAIGILQADFPDSCSSMEIGTATQGKAR